MTPRTDSPTDQLHALPFTPAEALAAGVSAEQLRSVRYRRIFRGVYASKELTLTPHLLLVAALKSTGSHSAIAAWTSLRLQRVALPLDAPGPETIHVLRNRGASCRGGAGLAIHSTRREIRAIEHPETPGLRFTDRPTSWVSLAMAGASIYQLVTVGDALMPRTGPSTSIESLRHRAESFGVFRGLANARAAIGLIRPGTDSPMESHVRLLVLAARLPEPTVNYVLRDESGVIAYLDLGFVPWRVDLEYDGTEHHDSVAARRKDADRDRATGSRGWLTLRCNGSILANPDPLLRDLHHALRSRGWDGAPTGFRYTREQLGIPVLGQTPVPALSGRM